tara:strand:- start:1749 stop:2138 length:390 start_codon:yes stop_codon:yes gene_type:complete
MALVLQTSARNAAADAIVDLIDAGTGAGTLELKSAASTTAGTNEVATLTFSDPAFGDAAAGVAAANAITSDTNATGGIASDFTVFDSDNNAVFQGDVGTSGSDINLSSTTIGAGDTVSISSMTLTQPAS